jgi:putative heme-binding domain-containing protein
MRRQLMLGLLAASAACAQHVIPTAASPDAAQAGSGLFRQHCGSCHGRRGQGGRAPDLTRTSFVTGNADADLFRTISNGIPGTDMGAYQGRITEEEIRQIIAFLRSAGRGDESLNADPKAGEALFWGKGNCGSCHLVGTRGNRAGPDLSRIGPVRSIPYLRESLTAPGANIMSNYSSITVVTKDGRTIRGLEKSLDDYSVLLMDLAGKVYSFDRSDLKSVERDKKSLMPEYGNVFTSTEMNNLLAYLLSLKGPAVTQ